MTTLAHTIVFVSDMQVSVRFYRDVLGLKLRFESPEWTEFDTGEVTLALHAAEAAEAAQAGSVAGLCSFGLITDDLESYHARLEQHGVNCLQIPSREEFGGKLAQYVDPDGLSFSVTERSA